MSHDFVYFDLETQRSANDVGGWNRKFEMRMSVGVTYSTRLGEYRVYDEDSVEELIDQLRRADLVVGYNHINFDYEVLMGYTALDLPGLLLSLDLCRDLEKRISRRIKLDDVAKATLGHAKSADGLQAIKWWREGKVMDIARYCCFDVKVTRCVHEFGIQNGFIRYGDAGGNPLETVVDWRGASGA